MSVIQVADPLLGLWDSLVNFVQVLGAMPPGNQAQQEAWLQTQINSQHGDYPIGGVQLSVPVLQIQDYINYPTTTQIPQIPTYDEMDQYKHLEAGEWVEALPSTGRNLWSLVGVEKGIPFMVAIDNLLVRNIQKPTEIGIDIEVLGVPITVQQEVNTQLVSSPEVSKPTGVWVFCYGYCTVEQNYIPMPDSPEASGQCTTQNLLRILEDAMTLVIPIILGDILIHSDLEVIPAINDMSLAEMMRFRDKIPAISDFDIDRKGGTP